MVAVRGVDSVVREKSCLFVFFLLLYYLYIENLGKKATI